MQSGPSAGGHNSRAIQFSPHYSDWRATTEMNLDHYLSKIRSPVINHTNKESSTGNW
ncbi:hypothetical protein Pan110_27190 [Gimesia panareensis]|nr:hypothetical protein Pan110_27190 [Gimesia panareensis]